MTILGDNNNRCDLSKVPCVDTVFASTRNKELTIHLACAAGNEQRVYDALPKWLHDMNRVTKSSRHVFIQGK